MTRRAVIAQNLDAAILSQLSVSPSHPVSLNYPAILHAKGPWIVKCSKMERKKPKKRGMSAGDNILCQRRPRRRLIRIVARLPFAGKMPS